MNSVEQRALVYSIIGGMGQWMQDLPQKNLMLGKLQSASWRPCLRFSFWQHGIVTACKRRVHLRCAISRYRSHFANSVLFCWRYVQSSMSLV